MSVLLPSFASMETAAVLVVSLKDDVLLPRVFLGREVLLPLALLRAVWLNLPGAFFEVSSRRMSPAAVDAEASSRSFVAVAALRMVAMNRKCKAPIFGSGLRKRSVEENGWLGRSLKCNTCGEYKE